MSGFLLSTVLISKSWMAELYFSYREIGGGDGLIETLGGDLMSQDLCSPPGVLTLKYEVV